MPFNLKNVGATYLRLMETVFSDQIGQNLEVYINNVVIKTPNEGHHYENLKETLSSVRRFNKQINPNKYSFRG